MWSSLDICWPLGIAADAQPAALCQRRLSAWALNGTVPPTFAERGARLWSAGRERVDVDNVTGDRVSASCSLQHATRVIEIARWPVLASPWLTTATRQASRLPPLAPDCMADGRDASQELRIEGLNDNATIARAPGISHGVRLSLRALGTGQRVQWLLDGRWFGETDGAGTLVRDFDVAGDHVLTALADSGAWNSVRFKVML